MKTAVRRLAAIAALFATLNIAFANTGVPSATQTLAPRVISTPSALTAQELARYQQKTAQTAPATHRLTAGASDTRTVWIVVGVVAVAGIVVLVASGGHGGGGGGGGGGY